jgi:hypothetical protein
LKELAVQKRLLESFIPKKPNSSSEGHEIYLKAKLINIMEEEMDMVTRTTRRDLNNMSEKELDTHFNKTKSMHKLSWDMKQRRNDIGEMDSQTALAAFQEKEGEQFRRTNSSAGGHV